MRCSQLAIIVFGAFSLYRVVSSSSVDASTAVPTPKAAAAATVCKLHLEGYGTRPGLKTARLACTGGSITAAAHPELLKALGPGRVEGVVWSSSDACKGGSFLGSCLLAVCRGSQAEFVRPVLNSIRFPFTEIARAVCIFEGSKVAISNGMFTDCGVRPITVGGNKTSVVIKNSSFVKNTIGDLSLGGALSATAGAHVIIRSSAFFNNTGGHRTNGGAIGAGADARVDIDPPGEAISGGAHGTIFQGNRASFGGDINIFDKAQVRMFGARLQGSSADQGGSVFIIGRSNVVLYDTVIAGAAAAFGGGGVAIDNNSSLLMVRSETTGCNSSWGGAIQAIGQSQVRLLSSNINENFAISGGGIVADGAANVTLEDTIVAGNTAAGIGGGLFMNANATLKLLGSTSISRNHAWDFGGGLLVASDAPFADDLHAFATNNSARVGTDIYFDARNVKLVRSNNNTDAFITSADSQGGLLYVTLNITGPRGTPTNPDIVMALIDEHNTTRFTETIPSRTNNNSTRDVVVKIRQPPGVYTVTFSVSPILPKPASGEGPEPAVLQLRIVPCPKGYATASTGDACIPCVKGYFSFNPLESECSLCVPNAECPGGAIVWPAKGFFHSAPQSIQMHRCFNPSACSGNGMTWKASSLSVSDYKAAQCSQPYAGNLCGDCKPGYGRAKQFTCRKCMAAASIIALYALGVLGMIVLIKALVHFSSTASASARRSLKEPVPVELLKVLLLHGQWLFIMSNMVGIPWPVTLTYPFQVIVGIWSSASGSSIGLECILPHDSAIPVAIQKVLICLLTPVAILCVVLSLEAILHRSQGCCLGGKRRQARLRDQVGSMMMSVVFLFLPMWLGTAFSLFTCVQLDQPATWPYQAEAVGSFWAEDMSQQCYSGAGYHKRWALGLGVPLIALLCFVLPAGVFSFTWHSRQQGKLQQPAFEQHYGFMYRLWREEVCWWEAVVLLQTMGLVMVSTFGFALGPYFQALVTGAVLVIVLVLLLWVRPFVCGAANTVAVQSASVLFLTVYTALTFLPYNTVAGGPVYGNIMGVVILLSNVLFLGVTACKLVRSVDWGPVQQLVRSALDKGCGVRAFSKASRAGGRLHVARP